MKNVTHTVNKYVSMEFALIFCIAFRYDFSFWINSGYVSVLQYLFENLVENFYHAFAMEHNFKRLYTTHNTLSPIIYSI